MNYPSYNTAATEAAIMGYAVLFNHKGNIGIVWWDGCFHKHRFLCWENINK